MSGGGRGRRKRRETRPVDRRVVLDAASRLLSEEGPAALSMRRVAAEAGTSTMVLYSRFGSRDGLVEQLLVEGFTRFADRLGEVNEPSALGHLRALGLAYRRFARENPTYYRLMWSSAPAPCDDPAEAPPPFHRVGQRAFGALLHAVTRVLAELDRPARDVEPLALAVWSTVHGFVSLELAGQIPAPQADAAYEQTLGFVGAALRPT